MPLSQLLPASVAELQAEMQLILNAVAEGVFGVDAQGNTTYCNDALLRMSGYGAEEVIGKSIHALMHHSRPDGTPYPEQECPIRKALQLQQPIYSLLEFGWRKNGTCFPVEYSAQPLPRPSTKTACVVTVRDMTEREQAIAALQTSEERFRQISSNVDQAFYLVDVTTSRLVYASPAFETITGYSCQEFVGKPSPWRDLAVPEHRETVVKGYARLAAGEETRSEYQIRHRDGSNRWIKDHAKPIRDGNGCVHLLAGAVEDITEIHAARDVLRQSEEKYRRILSSVADVAWTSDREGRTIYVSPKVEGLLGYTKGELCSAGSALRMGLIHPADFGRVSEAYRALFEKDAPFDQEYRLRRKDGGWVWIHDRATGIREENTIFYADGAFSDITRRKREEAELQWKTAFLEAQANSTIDGILVVDGNGRRLLQNQRFVELFHVPQEVEANPDDRPTLAHVLSLMKDPESFLSRVKWLYQHPEETSRDELELKDGTVVDRYSAPVVDKAGKYYGRVWTFRDITERKRNEDTLRQLSVAVEQSPVSVVITDTRAAICYVNRKFTDITGYAAEEVLGRNPRILRSGLTAPHVYRSLWSAIKSGREWRGELCNRKKNGDLYWEAVKIQPIIDAKGAATHYLALKEDITERRRAERELRLTKFSLENASASVFWIDPQAHILYANEAACRALGRSRDELISLTIPDIDPLFPAARWPGFWEELKMRRSMTFETQHRHQDGRVFPVEVTANYLEFDGQEYLFAMAGDISARRELENQLRQAQKLEGIGQLAAGIAHEINTPTQFVTDNLLFLSDSWKAIHELIEQYRGAMRDARSTLAPEVTASLEAAERTSDLAFIAEEVPRAIDQSLDGAHRVAKIVRAMKEFSHPDSADRTVADLNQAVESTITVARTEWKYVADVVTELDDTLPPILCYPGDINQVILNVLVNAAHAIQEKVKDGEKGTITVRTGTRGEFAEISVTDTGTGIPEAVRSRVFDPFFTTKEVGKGTGQGLSLAHTLIVKKHSGKIWFETEIGRGTTFFINLPIQPPDRTKED